MSAREPCFPLLSRRGFLLATAGAAVTAACGDDGDTVASADEGRSRLTLVPFLADGTLAAGRDQRLPVGFADGERPFVRATPAEVRFRVMRDGADVGEAIEVARHGRGLDRPYYPVRLRLPDPGPYVLVAELDDGVAEASFEVAAPRDVRTPDVGDRLVPVPTPTTWDARGVEPICTRVPACAMHAVSLDTALGRGRRVAFLVASPAHCQIEVCGPVLEVVQSFHEGYGDRVEMVHAEVYTDAGARKTTRAVKAYHLRMEPVLWLAGADGVVRARLDRIFDEVEVRAALESLVS